MITPILKDPKAHGGTLYTFPSASRDLTRAFTNSEYEFAFSHFACLNLPDFRYGEFEDGDLKGVYLDSLYPNVPGVLGPNTIDNAGDINTALKWHMQSYIMNYEVAILNGFSLDAGKYDNEILRTPSERIFFNWLQKVGAIKFNGISETIEGYGNEVDLYDEVDYDDSLTDESQLPSAPVKGTEIYRIGNKLYKWKGGEWKSRILVSKTVQYIGTIDMINNVNIDYDSFNEIYLNIPAGVGASDVKFDFDLFDSNYESGEFIDVDKDDYCENPLYVIGRDPIELNMSDDKTIYAIYDKASEALESDELDHSYKIDNAYCINFNDNIYSGGSIEEMNLNSEEDFEFNCVLIYYRIRRGNGEWYTNLYGVLFLEEVVTSDYNVNLNEDDERAGYIQRYPKFKKGNSWGLKLDLKIDAQPDSQLMLRDKEYTDPNDAIAMQLFTDALVQLNDCTNLFYEVKKENTDIEERLYKLENMVSGVDTVYNLRDEVSVLKSQISMFQPTLDSLGNKMNEVENRMTKLESNLGYLIGEIQNTNRDIYSRISEIKSNLDNLIKPNDQ